MWPVNMTGKTKGWPVNSQIGSDIVRWPAVISSPAVQFVVNKLSHSVQQTIGLPALYV